jgi:transposase
MPEKNALKPWREEMWCIPKAGPEYAACLEDVLDVYEQPKDEDLPVVCFDEWKRALVSETRVGLPLKAGQARRYDYEYQRNGLAYLHLLFAPLLSQRFIRVTQQHTMHDFAHTMKWLVDELFPRAKRIIVVLDNLATHKPAALYATFPASEAHRILRKLEFHYTPKHGSWLNMAEIELSVLSRTLKAFLPDVDTLLREASALSLERNRALKTVHWQFTTADARIKLKNLYPSFSA